MKIVNKEEQIQTLADKFRSIRPSFYVPGSEEAKNRKRAEQALQEALKINRGTKTGAIMGMLMQGADIEDVASELKIGTREINRHIAMFALDYGAAYKMRERKK